MPAGDYIGSHTFFKHLGYTSRNHRDDIGLIKLESPFKVREAKDENHRVVNIICLPVRTFRLKGSQIATIAGSGLDLDRVKTGSTRLYEIPNSHLNRYNNDFGSLTCPVSSHHLHHQFIWYNVLFFRNIPVYKNDLFT